MEQEYAGMSGEINALKNRNAELESKVRKLTADLEAAEQASRPLYVLADNISDNIYFKDLEFRYRWVNRNMHLVHGFPDRGGILGKTSWDIFDPARAQQVHADDERVIKTGEYILNKLETGKYADGTPMWNVTTKIPLRDPQGNIIGLCGISKDFTRMILAEQVLSQEGVLRNDLLENLPDGVWFKDRESRFTWVNKHVLEILNLSNLSDILGKTDFDLFSKEHAEEARQDEIRIMESGQAITNKLEQDNYGDGTPRWVYTTKIPLKDSHGNIIGTCGITKDVTTLKKAEGILVREGALMNDLLNNTPDIVFFKDRESRFTWVNSAMFALTGMSSKAEVLGKTDFDFFSREHAQAARDDELKIMSDDKHVINKLEVDNYADGTPRYSYTFKKALHDMHGEIVGTCGISRDVTALKKAEEALALESNLLKVLLDNIPDAIYFKDAQSRFVRVSRAIHLEGIQNVEDAIGKSDFDFFSIEHAQQAFDDEQEIMRSGIPIVDKVERETFTNNRPDAWVSTTKVPVYGTDGQVSGLVGISRDVTERMAAQEIIRKAKDDLEIRVQDRTAALVQEIKEHLRTERALREGEKLLQQANLGLESRVGQLHFLNSAAHQLALYPHRKELLPAIVKNFVGCHPGIEAAICEMGNAGYECGATSTRLSEPEHRRACAGFLSQQGQEPLLFPITIANRKTSPEIGKINFLGMEDYPVYLAIPLLVEEKPLAVVQIFAPTSFLSWYEQENVIINTLATQAAISLSNANNFLELDKKARLASELEVAQTIQRRFTPKDKPNIPRINLSGAYYPANEVGGDYLDYFQTDQGSWVIVIADVSGKGIPAALVMTMLRSTFRAEARYENSAKKLMCAVNDLMLKDLDDKSFVTALCLIVDKEGKSMSYARAGHPPLLIQRAGSGEKPSSINSKGMALGIVGGPMFVGAMEELEIELVAGDRFLIFTDGLLDAMDKDRNFYGLERLLKILTGGSAFQPDLLLKRILEDVRVFTRNEPYHDDLTMLAMEVQS